MARILPPIREVSNDAMEHAIKGESSGGRDNGVTGVKLDGIQHLIMYGWKPNKLGLPDLPMPCWRW